MNETPSASPEKSVPETNTKKAAVMALTHMKAVFWTIPMVIITLFMFIGGQGLPKDPLRLYAMVITLLFLNGTFFLILFTGRVDRFRATAFVTVAVLFVVGFISNFQESRGSMSVSQGEMIKGRTPFCHMVIPQTAVVTALTKSVIFPGSLFGHYSIASMIVIWLGVSLALGRGFCSWGCFFGGLEDGFSRILKKARIPRIPLVWTYTPYIVLLLVISTSTILLSPFYCEWLCPFKTVTEYPQVNSLTTLIQLVIFSLLFIGLVVVLPIATKRRTQCGLFCPMGAFQSFTNGITPFAVRVDRTLCNNCQRCEQVCPTFSMSKESRDSGKTRLTCIRCGACVDACRRGALSYHIKGTPIQAYHRTKRLLFLFASFSFLAIFGGSMICDGLYRLLLFLTTGTFLH